MPTTILGEVTPNALAVVPQNIMQAIPQAADPATTANSQLYVKGTSLFHKDSAGLITNLLAAPLAAANALGGVTTTYPYGSFNQSGPLLLNSGASQNSMKGYVARGSGSVIGATWFGAAPNAVNGSVQVYKNNALFFTALPNANFPGNNSSGGPVSATFLAGAYPFVKNDYFDVYYSGSGSSLYMGVGITFTEGNTYANALSTALTANTTVAPTDNQRTWLATASTAYTLTLPATQAAQDFYVRLAVTQGAGLVVQAPSGVTIYKGGSTSSAGGTLTVNTVGAYITLYNAAGTNLWLMTDPSAPGNLA